MAYATHHPVGADVSLAERHPALMCLVALLGLVLFGGLVGVAIGRALVLGLNAVLGVAGQGM